MEFSNEKARYAIKSLRCLIHPVKGKIINLLEKEKKMDVTNIIQVMNLPQPIISHHLVEMKRRNILISKREGRNVIYSINPFFLDELKKKVENCVAIELVIK